MFNRLLNPSIFAFPLVGIAVATTIWSRMLPNNAALSIEIAVDLLLVLPYLLYLNRRQKSLEEDNAYKSKAIHESEELLLRANETAEIGAYFIDYHQNLVVFSPQLCKIHRLPIGTQMPIEQAMQLVHADDRERLEKEGARAIEPNSLDNTLKMEIRIIRQDGEIRWISFSAKVEFENTPQGRIPIRQVGACIDITEQKFWNDRVIGILNSVLDSVLLIDQQGKIIFENDKAGASFGYRKNELINKTLDILLPEGLKETYRQYCTEYFKAPHVHETTGNREFSIRRKDGSTFPAEFRLSPIKIGSETFVSCMIRDVSSRRRDEETLRKALLTAESASRAKSDFLATISHEIRTPLGVILGYTDMIANPEKGDLNFKQYAQIIRRNGRHLLTLLNDILDMSKVESGQIEVDIHNILSLSFYRDIIQHFELRAQEKSLTLQFMIEDAIPDQIRTDDTRFRQILYNLIGNAIKFTDRGSVTITASFFSKDKKNFLKTSVKDTGCGISKESQEQIFDPFTQAEKYISRVYGGSGLGLGLARKLAQKLGGDVILENSQPGDGSIFSAFIEVGHVDSSLWVKQHDFLNWTKRQNYFNEAGAPLLPCHDRLKGARILVAEDFEDNQNMLRLMLQTAGAAVDIAANGSIAVQMCSEKHYDVILMDIQMPVTNGYEATRFLRNNGYAGPIIALTAHAMKGELEHCLEAGCDDFVSKPVQRKDLIDTVSSYFSNRMPPKIEPEYSKAPILSTFDLNDEVLKDLLPQFIEKLPRLFSEIKDAFDSQNWKKLGALCHQLKGAGGSYGFPDISQACKSIETSLSDHSTDNHELQKGVDHLSRILDRINLGASRSQIPPIPQADGQLHFH